MKKIAIEGIITLFFRHPLLMTARTCQPSLAYPEIIMLFSILLNRKNLFALQCRFYELGNSGMAFARLIQFL